MSMYPSVNPVTAALRDYPPGAHSGVDPDPDAHVAPDSMNSRARTSLTLGLFSFLLSVVTGIPAIWVGAKSLREIRASDVAVRGRWAAWTGIALGCLSIAAVIGVWTYLHYQD